MPATTELVLTKIERRQRWVALLVGEVCVGIIVLLATTLFVATCFFVWLEGTVAFGPFDCFDTLSSCDVVKVEHQYNSSDPRCADDFVYEFKLPGSPAIFMQIEERARPKDACSLDFNIGSQNATYQNGTNECFRVKDLFASYYASFRCASVLLANNSTVASCQTLLTPKSDHNPTIVLGVSIAALLFATFQGVSFLKRRYFRPPRE